MLPVQTAHRVKVEQHAGRMPRGIGHALDQGLHLLGDSVDGLAKRGLGFFDNAFPFEGFSLTIKGEVVKIFAQHQIHHQLEP